MDYKKEKAEKYLEEYRKLIEHIDKIVTQDPEMAGLLREALSTSMSLMISNKPGVVEDTRSLAKELDTFLAQKQDGQTTNIDSFHPKKGRTN